MLELYMRKGWLSLVSFFVYCMFAFGLNCQAGETEINAQIQKLNAPDAVQREDAERELLKIGTPALELLKQAAATSKDPEIAARAKKLVSKLMEAAAKPIISYAEAFPENTVFFLEVPHSRETLDKMKGSFLGQFWDLPATQKFFTGHRDGSLPNEQKVLDAIRAIPKLLTGRALLAFGAPDTADTADLEPPLVYVFETKQAPSLEQQARSVFDGMGDPPKGTRHYGPFNVEEHITAQTVFGEDSIIHSLTQTGVESFLTKLLQRPEKSLDPALKDIRAQLPQYDFVLHLSSDSFKDLADNALLIDDDLIELFNTLGFVAGSRWQHVSAVNSDGFEEANRITLGKSDGLLSVLSTMAANMPPPVQPGAPQALDLIPWQAAALISFQGDSAKYAAPLAKALRAWDLLHSNDAPQPQPQPTPIKQGQGVKPQPPPIAPPRETAPDDPKAIGKEALAGAKAKAPQAAQEEKKAPPPAGIAKHLIHFEKIGLKLEQIFEQVDGPIQVAMFMQQIEEDTPPDEFPISPVIACMLKDPKVVEQALQAACAGDLPGFSMQVLNGGSNYREMKGDKPAGPGFWLKDNYLAWSTDGDLLELASAAMTHKVGTERIADRAAYKQAWIAKRLTQESLLTIFGDADQVLEMPYKLARVNWQEDENNPWPNYSDVKALLKNKPISVQVSHIESGIQIKAQTPFTLLGLIELFRRSLIEARF